MLLDWDPNYSRYLRRGVAAFPAAALLLPVRAAAPVRLGGSSAARKRWTKSLCFYQAGTQSWFFLFAMFQGLLGSLCL